MMISCFSINNEHVHYVYSGIEEPGLVMAAHQVPTSTSPIAGQGTLIS